MRRTTGEKLELIRLVEGSGGIIPHSPRFKGHPAIELGAT